MSKNRENEGQRSEESEGEGIRRRMDFAFWMVHDSKERYDSRSQDYFEEWEDLFAPQTHSLGD